MSDPVQVAMIGLGFGAEFIPIYQAHPNANVAAVCRRNETELKAVADQFGIEKRYTSYDDVLADKRHRTLFTSIVQSLTMHGCHSRRSMQGSM